MVGREEQINNLENYFSSEKNNLTILYGRHRTGKTELIRNFCANKNSFYFYAIPAVDFEMLTNFNYCIENQIENYQHKDSFGEAFEEILNNTTGSIVFIFEEFQNIIKVDPTFTEAIEELLSSSDRKIMIILSSSSVAWVENSMVKAIGKTAYCINSFMKLKELGYADLVEMFPECDADTILCIQAITGGIPGYGIYWNSKLSVKNNLCRLLLDKNSVLFHEAENFVRDEFRETGVYNTILSCLASGMNKLNEIHDYTGFGRDKISVYLNNLIEREIVEKVFSYDKGGNTKTRKGLYRVQDSFLEFWYRFIYPNRGMLELMDANSFYDIFIEPEFEMYKKESYIKVAREFIDILNDADRLETRLEYAGRWYGKTGDIHIIYSGDNYDLISQIYTNGENVSYNDYEKLIEETVNAQVNPAAIYLFTTKGFDSELVKMQSEKLKLIRIEDL